MVVPMFDASMVNAYGPCVQGTVAGERWCGLRSLPTTFLAKESVGRYFEFPKVTEQDA